MVDSLFYLSRKIPEWCKNSFVDYRINYQKLCYSMRQITKDLNSLSLFNVIYGAITLQYVRGEIQCMNAAAYVTVFSTSLVLILPESLHSNSLVLPSLHLINLPFDLCDRAL